MRDPSGITGPKSALKTRLTYNDCFVPPIFSSFGFWYYFGHFSCVIFFPFFSVTGNYNKMFKTIWYRVIWRNYRKRELKRSNSFFSWLILVPIYGAATEEPQIFVKPKKVHPWMAQNVDLENGVSMATANQCPKGECPRMA